MMVEDENLSDYSSSWGGHECLHTFHSNHLVDIIFIIFIIFIFKRNISLDKWWRLRFQKWRKDVALTQLESLLYQMSCQQQDHQRCGAKSWYNIHYLLSLFSDTSGSAMFIRGEAMWRTCHSAVLLHSVNTWSHLHPAHNETMQKIFEGIKQIHC